MAVVRQGKSRIIWVFAWTALKMFENGIHKVLKFFNKPTVYLGMVENQLKRLRKGGYTYGAMLAWQMVFVLFMSSQLCLCSFKKSVWVESCREVVQTPSLGKLLSMLRQKQFQASRGRQKIYAEDDGSWWSQKMMKLMQRRCRAGKEAVRQISQKMKTPSQGQEENGICSVA